MNTSILFLVLFLFSYATSLFAQMPVITNEREDTIPYTFPPPSDSYVPNELELSGLTSGIYFIRISAGNKTGITKLQVVR